MFVSPDEPHDGDDQEEYAHEERNLINQGDPSGGGPMNDIDDEADGHNNEGKFEPT